MTITKLINSGCRHKKHTMSREGALWVGGLESYMDDQFVIRALVCMGEPAPLSVKVTCNPKAWWWFDQDSSYLTTSTIGYEKQVLRPGSGIWIHQLLQWPGRCWPLFCNLWSPPDGPDSDAQAEREDDAEHKPASQVEAEPLQQQTSARGEEPQRVGGRPHAGGKSDLTPEVTSQIARTPISTLPVTYFDLLLKWQVSFTAFEIICAWTRIVVNTIFYIVSCLIHNWRIALVYHLSSKQLVLT